MRCTPAKAVKTSAGRKVELTECPLWLDGQVLGEQAIRQGVGQPCQVYNDVRTSRWKGHALSEACREAGNPCKVYNGS